MPRAHRTREHKRNRRPLGKTTPNRSAKGPHKRPQKSDENANAAHTKSRQTPEGIYALHSTTCTPTRITPPGKRRPKHKKEITRKASAATGQTQASSSEREKELRQSRAARRGTRNAPSAQDGASALGGGLDRGGGLLVDLVLRERALGKGVLLGLEDRDHVGEGDLGARLARGVEGEHNLDLDAEHTLAEEDVAHGRVHVVARGLARVDHEAVRELHALGTLGAELARHNDLAALGAVLHDEAENTVARTAHGEATEELVPERLALRDGAEAAVGDLLSVELHAAVGEVEALLHDRRELADAAALLAEHVLRARGADDDLRARGRHADLNARVAILGELTREQLVELGEEDSVRDELALPHVLCVDT
eukprot:Opistho-1_new@50747